MGVNVTISLGALHRLEKSIATGLIGGTAGTGPFDVWRTQAAARYSAFSVRRFNVFSRGGGDWPALAVSTINARRGPARGRGGKGGGSAKGIGARSSLGRVTTAAAKAKYGPLGFLRGVGSGRAVSILVDTGILKNAVGVGGAGNSVKRIRNGLTYGFNYTPHIGGRSKSHPTIGQLAAWHQHGDGNLPVRKILVNPDAQTQAGITADAQRAFNRAIRESKAGA